jgi:hypothetical protein
MAQVCPWTLHQLSWHMRLRPSLLKHNTHNVVHGQIAPGLSGVPTYFEREGSVPNCVDNFCCISEASNTYYGARFPDLNLYVAVISP